jgi:hypothetical protein
MKVEFTHHDNDRSHGDKEHGKETYSNTKNLYGHKMSIELSPIYRNELSNDSPHTDISIVPKPPNDRVKDYIKRMSVWKTLAQQDWNEKKILREIRLKKTLQRKKMMVKQNIKKNVFYIHRWKYIGSVSI